MNRKVTKISKNLIRKVVKISKKTHKSIALKFSRNSQSKEGRESPFLYGGQLALL